MVEHALDQFLRNRVDENFLIVPPAGNWGDLLLRSGFRKRANEIGLSYQRFGDFQHVNVIDIIGNANPLDPNLKNIKSIGQSLVASFLWTKYKSLPNFDSIYLHGGAHFSDVWGSGIGCFRIATKLFDCAIVIGPQSCLFEETDPAEIFSGVDNHVHLFCREEYSYDIMDDAVGHLNHVRVELSQDTAFYLDEEDLAERGTEKEYTLIAKREDKESAESVDIEVSTRGKTVEEDISETRESLDEFLNVIARAEKVYTDRLHVAVPATILGKPTRLYPNSYHKNRGIYEQSLSNFDNIEFAYPGCVSP